MRFQTLDAWLAWQESLHPTAMDLGLERVREVVERLDWSARGFPLITVAGTNGKGSTVAWIEAALVAQGVRVGTYTSPHLVRYNERIRIDGVPETDDAIMASFAALDDARREITLTYFEFGTLAAMDRFVAAGVEVAVMEVGIGGRLDAVNVFDADIAVITTIDLDHQRWLGDTRESIGREKAGILRPGRPAVCAERNPPGSVREVAATLGAPLSVLGEDFDHGAEGEFWTWRGTEVAIESLPLPALAGDFQLDNAAGAIRALGNLPARLRPGRDALAHALRNPGLRGRFERVARQPDVFVDVGHNPQALSELAANLAGRETKGRTFAVAALLVDKVLDDALAELLTMVDEWFVTGLEGPRGDDGRRLTAHLEEEGAVVTCHADTLSALAAARAAAGVEDRIVAFGSFYLVGDILAAEDSWTRG